MNLHVGNKTLQLWHTPGHSADSIVCLVKEDRVLFAADTVMPIPYFVGGNYDAFLNSLNSLRQGNFENIIQGHGEVILRGEIEERLQEDIDYLQTLHSAVNHALSTDNPDQALQAIDAESCGKSRILLNAKAESCSMAPLSNYTGAMSKLWWPGTGNFSTLTNWHRLFIGKLPHSIEVCNYHG